jgi:DNA oxidative demethylase
MRDLFSDELNAPNDGQDALARQLPNQLANQCASRLPKRESIAPGAWLLPGFALDLAPALLATLEAMLTQAPLRHMVTPGGLPMSVATSSCGRTGWISDSAGYRYAGVNPQTGIAWPPMPALFSDIATRAAAAAGYAGYTPDTCLINRYAPGTRLTLHQDKNERDFTAPIVSISLGLRASFLFGGLERQHPTGRLWLYSGDVVVWGGPSRLVFHGIAPLGDGIDPLTGRCRINLTFRQAL